MTGNVKTSPSKTILSERNLFNAIHISWTRYVTYPPQSKSINGNRSNQTCNGGQGIVLNVATCISMCPSICSGTSGHVTSRLGISPHHIRILD
eukprot:1041690_1